MYGSTKCYLIQVLSKIASFYTHRNVREKKMHYKCSLHKMKSVQSLESARV